jgi:pimeloyl-ACP methyl ester carboxylesterase
VLVYATSFGSFWGLRLAAIDHTVRAIAAPQASVCEKFIQTDLESPRWKQLFAFLTQAGSEEELDALMADMTMEGLMGDVVCPTLLTVGEFDPRAPLEPTLAMFDEMKAPAEMWVMADQHHWLSVGGGDGWHKGSHSVCLDWLRDRYADKPLRYPGEVLWVDSPAGPNAANPGRLWFKNAAHDEPKR